MESESRPQDGSVRAGPSKRVEWRLGQELCEQAASEPEPLQWVAGIAEGARQASVDQYCAPLTFYPSPTLSLECGPKPSRTPSRTSCWVHTVAELGHGTVWKLPKLLIFLTVSMLWGVAVKPSAQASSPAT